MKALPTRLALVVPVYNEAELVGHALAQILSAARSAAPGSQLRLFALDDGSTDGTRAALARLAGDEPALRYASFTRNFGKEAAIQAGLQLASDEFDPDVAIVLDADLQHPPELIAPMLQAWRQGAEVVEAVKRDRGDEGVLRRWAAAAFYKAFSRFSGLTLQEDTDFKLLGRQPLRALIRLGERARFFRGMVRWLGYPSVRIPFDVPARAGGRTGWSIGGLARYAWKNLTAFSAAPLSLVTAFGAVGLGLGAVLGVKVILDKVEGRALSGFTTVILLQILFSSLLLLSLGIIGSYIARIYEEIKQRPHYILRPEDKPPRPEDPS